MNNISFNTWDEQEKERNMYRDIDKAERRYKSQQIIVDDAKNILDLLYEDYIRQCKQYKTRYDLLNDVIKSAFREQHNKKKSEKEHFITLQSMMRKDFFDNDSRAKITDIARCGYEGYSYWVTIDYNGVNIRIDLPILSVINTTNAEYAHYGKIACFIKENDCCFRALCISYKINDIVEAIKKYLTNSADCDII